MSLSYDAARDLILAVFKAAWDVTGFPVVYDDVAANVPDSNTVWARVTLRHATGGRASLSGPINGCVRYNRTGVVIIQVFAPVGGGMKAAYDAAKVVSDAFEDSSDLAVWFRNVRINEIGVRGACEQINVLADFTYDDMR
jgi:hypothetical protein